MAMMAAASREGVSHGGSVKYFGDQSHCTKLLAYSAGCPHCYCPDSRPTISWTAVSAVSPLRIIQAQVASCSTPWLVVSLGECACPGTRIVFLSII